MRFSSYLKGRLAINIFGCNVSIADPAGSFDCLKDKASEEFKKGIGGLLALIEKAKSILDCTGISDVVDLTTRFFRDPGGTIKGTWDRVVGFVKTIGAGVAASATELGMEAIKLLTGTNISHQVLDKVMALMWSTGEEMAKFSGPARCLMGFLKENRSTVEGPARAVVQGVIDLIPTISNLAQDLLAKAGAVILDKVLPKLLGEDRAKRLKEFFEKAFGPAALQDEAGRRLNAAIEAIRTRAPNAKTPRSALDATPGDHGSATTVGRAPAVPGIHVQRGSQRLPSARRRRGANARAKQCVHEPHGAVSGAKGVPAKTEMKSRGDPPLPSSPRKRGPICPLSSFGPLARSPRGSLCNSSGLC
jgi:hypothetical protein